MYICIRRRMYTCTYVNIYIYTYIYTYVYTKIDTYPGRVAIPMKKIRSQHGNVPREFLRLGTEILWKLKDI